MKKFLTACAISLVAAPAFADVTPLFKVYGGVGQWTAEFSGDLGSTDTDISDLGFDEEDNTFFYAGFEHPVPLLPNIRIESTSISATGSATLSSDYEFNGTTFSESEVVDSEIDLTFTDGTLYWEILLIDFGLTLRQFDAEVSAESQTTSEFREEKTDAVLPMLYLASQVDLPFTGVYVAGSVNAISFDGKSLTDFRGGVGYHLEVGPLAELGAELGYRSFSLDLGEDEDIEGKIDLSGIYFGVNVTF